MKILIVEDDKKAAASLKSGLEAAKFTVETTSDGKAGLELVLNRPYDAVLFGAAVPGLNGFAAIKKIREFPCNVPLIIISAKDSLEDKITALNAGADDYFAKPVNIDELVARIRAIIRRVLAVTTMRCGDIILNSVARTAHKGNDSYELTNKEYLVLEYLMQNTNKILSRASIIQNVWNQNLDADSNIIDVYVKRLRTKFEKKPNASPYIQSIRGIGYRFRERAPIGIIEEKE